MKIAIPTEDGIMLSSHAINPGGYLVITIEGGEITGEELRLNKLSDFLTAKNGILYNLEDCSSMIVNMATADLQDLMNSQKVRLVTTKEVIITKIIMQYLHTTLLLESNTCCSP